MESNFLINFVPNLQQGMPMRQPMMSGVQPGIMASGIGSPQSQTILPQQISTEHQNGKNNNVQLDPFGAF